MDLDVVFLGTSASAPTAQRSPAAVLVRRGGERLLFDCGEGTQRQLQRSAVGLPDLEEIFLTHYHADHFLGLPGMLKTFGLRGRDETPLTVYGPRGLRELFKQLQPFVGRLPYPARSSSSSRGRRCRAATTRSSRSRPTTESPRSGTRSSSRSVPVGSMSLSPTRSACRQARRAGGCRAGEDVELPDGRTVTPADVLGEPRARAARGHLRRHRPVDRRRASRARRRPARARGELPRRRGGPRPRDEPLHAAEAAEVARLAQVRLLALTHVSPRYFGPELAEEARAVFPNTVVPRDFDVIEVPFRRARRAGLVERGARPPRPELSDGVSDVSRLLRAWDDRSRAAGSRTRQQNVAILERLGLVGDFGELA